MNIRDLMITMMCGCYLFDWVTHKIRMMNYRRSIAFNSGRSGGNRITMQVQGFVVDETTGNGIPGASVTITDSQGKPTGEGVVANNQGAFKYDFNTLDTAGYMLFSSVGYQSALVPYSVILETGFIQLQLNAQTLADVVVTPGKKVVMGGLLLAVALLTAAHFNNQK